MTLDTLAFLFAIALLTTHTAGAWQAEWIRLDPAQRIQPRRSGLVSFVDAPRNISYIFGGYAEEVETRGDGNGDLRRYTTNDVWKWEDEQWQSVVTTGDAPAPRLVGAAAVLGSTAYLIGGWNSDAVDPANILLDTVHALDLSKSSAKPNWRLLDAKIPDGTASRHVVVALANNEDEDATLLMHHHRCVDYVWLFDGQDFCKQPTTGTCPSPRGLHAACLLADNQRVVVFGGAAQDQTMSNQVYVLDTKAWEWTELVPRNDESNSNNGAPCPRAGHNLCPLDEDHVLVFGGAEATANGLQAHNDLWVFQLSTRQWTCLEPIDKDILPPPRNAAALFRTTPSWSSSSTVDFLLTNGWAPFKQTFDDCYGLRVTRI
jgi:hypothetical protein